MQRRPMSRRQFVQLLLTSVGVTALAACTTRDEQYVVKIDVQSQYLPPSLTIPVGAVVTWQNIGILPHTATCDPTKAQDTSHVLLPDQAQAWDSGQLYPGQTWTYRFDTPGNYIYFSRYRESVAMLGSIAVVE